MKRENSISSDVRAQLALLNVDQVCAVLNVKKDWLYDEVKGGRVPHLRLGRAIRFRPDDLAEWLEAHVRRIEPSIVEASVTEDIPAGLADDPTP